MLNALETNSQDDNNESKQDNDVTSLFEKQMFHDDDKLMIVQQACVSAKILDYVAYN